MSQPNHIVSARQRKALALLRFRSLMFWMAAAAIGAVIVAIVYLKMLGGPFPIHMLIATIAGVGFTVLLGAALMGLVFLSSGSGHDEDAADSTRADH